MDINLEKWAEELRKEVCLKWKEYEEKLPKGFELFYSPVRMSPDVMIIGFNPGGGTDDVKCYEEPEPLAEHGYITYGLPRPGKKPYRLAEKMYQLFKEMGHEKTLQNSVKLNLIFFRSGDIKEWNNMDKVARKDLDNFCCEKVKNVISTLQPKLILTEGLLTYRRLKDLMPIGKKGEKEDVFPIGSRTLVRSIDSEPIKLTGIRHPTGGRPPLKNEEWQKIIPELTQIFRSFGIRP